MDKVTPVANQLDLMREDALLLEACLEIHRCLELPAQLQAIVGHARAWSGARYGFGFGPAEERREWSLVATSLPAKDGLHAMFGKVDLQALRSPSAPKVEIYEGIGPLAQLGLAPPDPAPAATTRLSIGGSERSTCVASVLLFHDRDPAGDFRQRIERLVEVIAPAVDNAVQVAAMRDLVIKDDTAHCFNRRYFEACLPDELARAGRFHAPLSLIFLDMDNLKQINKRFGHAMGSHTLCEVSRRIRQKIRRFDKLFRFGGDEFCIVLPETEWHGALEVAERVREAIASQPMLVQELDDPGGASMTASLGIASFPLHARTQGELVELADRAMQRIKNSTKDAIGIAEVASEGEPHDEH